MLNDLFAKVTVYSPIHERCDIRDWCQARRFLLAQNKILAQWERSADHKAQLIVHLRLSKPTEAV